MPFDEEENLRLMKDHLIKAGNALLVELHRPIVHYRLMTLPADRYDTIREAIGELERAIHKTTGY